ncbi:MAG TPA: (2Fe-2S)-binding protein [Candidatus Binataceae bacterium]|nr:(2Fe-2S)-binding protein [Candidatus Binataceae bacterium]
MADKETDKSKPARLSRRAFIKGAGAAAAVAGLIGTRPSASATEPEPSDQHSEGAAERLGPGPETIELMVNGATRRLTLEPRVTLLEALRDYLGLYGTKLVCDRGACGACTVHLDGNPVTSCMMLAVDARGHEVKTIEGLGSPGHMHPVQDAFVEADALQCGFCTPGMIMSIAAALDRNAGLTLEEIKQAVAGNICRCGTYPHVFKAALGAAARLRGAKPPGGNA